MLFDTYYHQPRNTMIFQYSTFSNGQVISITTTTKISSEILELNGIIHEMDLTDTSRIFHLNTKECIFSAAHRSNSKIDHILGHMYPI